MPWVEFTADFDWHVPQYNGRVTVPFPKGARLFVTRACAEEALRLGRATRIARPKVDHGSPDERRPAQE